MDNSAYITALSALAGSAIGAASSLITTWLTQSSTARSQRLQREEARQETLFAEFIDEASRVYADALSHPLDDLGKMVKIYAIMNRMRLFAPADIIAKADKVTERLVETYFAPNLTASDIRAMLAENRVDLLRDFSDACRKILTPKLHETGG